MRRNSLITLIMAGVALVLVVVLAVVLLTQCMNASPQGASSESSSSSASHASYTPPSSAAVPSSQSALPPSSVPAPSSSSSEAASSSSEPAPQPAPVFSHAPAATVSEQSVSVSYQTDVESTVNAILSTSGEGISVSQFYDYFNRNESFDWAVEKHTVYTVTQDGKTLSFELPDLDESYYLYINAVENESGTWQNSVTVIPLYQAPISSSSTSGSISTSSQSASISA